MASAKEFLRKAVLPDSRSLLTCAVRLGFTGIGGGGMVLGVSRVRRERCNVLRAFSSAVSDDGAFGCELEMAFVPGSRCSGRRVNVSGDSIFA